MRVGEHRFDLGALGIGVMYFGGRLGERVVFDRFGEGRGLRFDGEGIVGDGDCAERIFFFLVNTG